MPRTMPSVFDVYAHEYDLITNAAQREEYHRREVAAMVDRFKPTAVLDAGCATGLTAILFAEAGVRAVGLDRSAPMIRVARQQAARRHASVDFVRGEFERLLAKLHGRFDLVVCLANSISGLSTRRDLLRALSNFHRALAPGGSLVLQALNFSSITEGRLFPIKATQNGSIVYERFSERRGPRLSVYVSRADFSKSPPSFEVFRHDFDNFDCQTIEAAVRQAGFIAVRRFADLYFNKRFGRSARDLVLTATRT